MSDSPFETSRSGSCGRLFAIERSVCGRGSPLLRNVGGAVGDDVFVTDGPEVGTGGVCAGLNVEDSG